MDLKDLGITRAELVERVVNRAADKALGYYAPDDEEGPLYSEIDGKVQEVVRERIDAAVHAIADEHILPNAQKYIDEVTLQRTNEWGDKKGKPVTFREYLVERAEAYMTEPVDHDGKPKSESRGMGGFRPYGTRIAHMIDKHLHFHIERAMQEAFQEANNAIAEGLNQAVRQKIDEVKDQIKVTAKAKR